MHYHYIAKHMELCQTEGEQGWTRQEKGIVVAITGDGVNELYFICYYYFGYRYDNLFKSLDD